MTFVLYEGPAGSGKSTELVDRVRSVLAERPLCEGQRVLGLTKMHGSRRRMDANLSRVPGVGTPQCQTFDAFAWQLTRRWRSLMKHLGLVVHQGDFAATTSAAAKLAEQPIVGAWLARSCPVVVVDELQDCKAAETRLLSAMRAYMQCFAAAADPFQDLSGDATCEAVEWATRFADVVKLDGNHRTDAAGILSAAKALRNGEPLVVGRRDGFELVTVSAAAQAGALVSWRMKSWRRHGRIAVLTPTKAPFSKKAVQWVATKCSTARNGSKSGPYNVGWELSDEDAAEELMKQLELTRKKAISCHELYARAMKVGAGDLCEWIHLQQYVRGRATVHVAEVDDAVSAGVRRRRIFGSHRSWRYRAMTIHQAKNREFESVIVLWPMRLQPDGEVRRRLLYNAITRARSRTVVVVMDPNGTRLDEPPFAAGE